MSYLSGLKKSWNYETNVPRCVGCEHFRPSRVYLIDSLPRTSTPICNLGGFTCRPNAICDKWSGKDGAELEPLVTITAVETESPGRVKCSICGKKVKIKGLIDHHRVVHS